MVPGIPQTLRTLFMVTVVITIVSAAGDIYCAECSLCFMGTPCSALDTSYKSDPLRALRDVRVGVSGETGCGKPLLSSQFCWESETHKN